MNFKQFKSSLTFRKYSKLKVIIRYIEYILKNSFIDILIKFNHLNFTSKKIIDIGKYKDNSYINFLLFSIKNDYCLSYESDENVKKLFRKIGFLNFFKHTLPNSKIKNKKKIKLNMGSQSQNNSEINIDPDYFQYFYDQEKILEKNNIIMPYFMYPRIYNSFYKKINIIKKPNFNFRIFFSGSFVNEGYGNFFWKKEPKKFPNRISTINSIINEFKNEIYFINSKNDLKTSDFSKKKIIFCLHHEVMKKTSYKLNFRENFKLLSESCFNLSCPGVVMPLCHHLIEGMKVGSVPITNCEKLLIPNLNEENSLRYSDLNQLIQKIYEALEMDSDKIMQMRIKVQEYYKLYLSPGEFKNKFDKIVYKKKGKIICCDDHRSLNGMI